MNAQPIPLPDEKPLPQVEHIALGVFDGFHLGHRAVIETMLKQSGGSKDKTAAVTFEPHPLTVIAPDRAPARLTTPGQREELLLASGVGRVLTLLFDSHLRELSAAEFLAQIHRVFPNLKSICVGPKWNFGKDRKGTVPFLRAEGARLGFSVIEVEPFLLEGSAVSSTRIRQAIRHKNFTEVAALLGRPYALAGEIVHGSNRGHQLGFPTANINLTGQLLPPDGVYAAYAQIDSDKPLRSVVNIGKRPTFGGSDTAVEAYILDLNRDLYGKRLELSRFHYLRSEKKFKDPEDLKAQIRADIALAQQFFK